MKHKQSRFSKSRQEFIEGQTERFFKRILSLQGVFWSTIRDNIILKLASTAGVVDNSSTNHRVIRSIGNLTNDFRQEKTTPMIKWFAAGIRQLFGLNQKYFQQVVKTPAVKRRSQGVLNKLLTRIGLNPKDDSLIKNGLLDDLTDLGDVWRAVKSHAFRSVEAGQPILQFREQLENRLRGKGDVATGLVEKHFERIALDSYAQFDREVQKSYADELGLKYAIYQGARLKTSRSFCIERKNKVFTTKEIASWSDLEWIGKPKGFYDPFTDLGGFNCVDSLDYISEELAFVLRPELKRPKAA